MPKTPVSVTLESDNLLWLRSRVGAEGRRSLSEVLDRLVTEARLGTDAPAAVRSVVGSIDLPVDDPDLLTADSYLTDLFGASVSRPVLVRERPPARSVRARQPRRG